MLSAYIWGYLWGLFTAWLLAHARDYLKNNRKTVFKGEVSKKTHDDDKN